MPMRVRVGRKADDLGAKCPQIDQGSEKYTKLWFCVN